MAVTAQRMDRSFAGVHAEFLAILQQVQHVQTAIAGPVLVIEPPADWQRLFWHRAADQFAAVAEIFVAVGRIRGAEVRDMLGRELPGFSGQTEDAALFFVDEMPPANWAHRCSYVLVRPGAEPVIVHHDTPPSAAIQLERAVRLAGA